MAILSITTCFSIALSTLGQPASSCYTEEFVVQSYEECEARRPELTNSLQVSTNIIAELSGREVLLPKAICTDN